MIDEQCWNTKYNLLNNETNELMKQYKTLCQGNNDKGIQYKSLQQQFDDLNDNYNRLVNNYIHEKKQWMIFHKTQCEQRTILQVHIQKIEKQLTEVTRNYRTFIPEKLSLKKTSSSVSPHHLQNVLSNINIILFQNDTYCFNYDDTIQLFDKIIKRFECFPYTIKHCIQCIESVHAYFDDAGIGGDFSEWQQKQFVLTVK